MTPLFARKRSLHPLSDVPNAAPSSEAGLRVAVNSPAAAVENSLAP